MVEKKATKTSKKTEVGDENKTKDETKSEAKTRNKVKTEVKTTKTNDKAKTETKARKVSKPGQKRNAKKIWAIVGAIIGGLVAIGLIIWAIVAAVINDQPLEQDWAQTYYVYLDENALNPELVDSDGKVQATADEYTVEFYDVAGVEQPVMVVNYIDADTNYVTYYWINGEGKDNIGKAILYSPSEVELLYNIASKETEYYIHYESGGTDYYQSLKDEILQTTDADDPNHVSDKPSYAFAEGDVTKVIDKDGSEHTLTKFEETFVEVDDDTEATVLPIKYEKSDLKKALKDEAYEYQVLEEVAKKHAEMIKSAVADIEKRQNEIAAVQQENAEIEAAKKAEEEAKKAAQGIQLEGYTIAYGTYLLDEDFIGPTGDEYTIVLKPDGACTYGGKPCTWTLGERDYAQSAESMGKHIHKSIFISGGAGSNYGTSLFAYGNNELGDGDIEHYIYAGH